MILNQTNLYMIESLSFPYHAFYVTNHHTSYDAFSSLQIIKYFIGKNYFLVFVTVTSKNFLNFLPLQIYVLKFNFGKTAM